MRALGTEGRDRDGSVKAGPEVPLLVRQDPRSAPVFRLLATTCANPSLRDGLSERQAVDWNDITG